MNNSSVTTGQITFSAVSLEPVVSWALNGFPHPIPESVPLLIAASVLTLGHALYNVASVKGWLPSAPPDN
jgi:hypothetical protein